MAGERFVLLNFKSLTERNSFHAGIFAVLVRPHREICDLGDRLTEGHSLTGGG